MKKILYTLLASVVLTTNVDSQTIYEASQLVERDLNGTARFVGMGGAMGALGGDLSTMGVNPAGIGIYRSNDVATTFGFSVYNTNSNYLGNIIKNSTPKGNFDNMGFVIASRMSSKAPLRYVNFGFNYHRSKSLFKNSAMEGNLGAMSQTYQMSDQAFGIDNWGNYPYEDPNIGWLSILGYDGYVLTDILSHSDLEDLLAQNPDFTNYEPYTDKDGNQIRDVEGNPMYVTPGDYRGLYNDANAKLRGTERGAVHQYDFNLSFNFYDRVYIGATLGAYAVDQTKHYWYEENYSDVFNGEDYTLQSWNGIKGSGVDFKLGAIIRPFAESSFRIGMAVHTPTFYHLSYTTGALIESNVYDMETGKILYTKVDTQKQLEGNGDMVRDFNLRTPWLFNLSLGYTIGRNLAIGLEYENQDFSTLSFRYPEGEQMDFETSQSSMLKNVHTVRLGLEYKPMPKFALRTGYNYTTSIFNENAFKDLPINAIQTDTDFANSKEKHLFTLGLGYRGNLFYADLAYKFSTYKEDLYPFINPVEEGADNRTVYTPEATKVTNQQHQLLLSIGMHF